MCAAARYDPAMLIFAAAALAAALPEPRVVTPERQAQATVTIIVSAELRFSEIEKNHPKVLREAKVRRADGSVETVKLVEFE